MPSFPQVSVFVSRWEKCNCYQNLVPQPAQTRAPQFPTQDYSSETFSNQGFHLMSFLYFKAVVQLKCRAKYSSRAQPATDPSPQDCMGRRDTLDDCS